MDPAPSQLAAAVMALLNTVIARSKDSSGLLWIFYQLSFSHWALEAYVIAEANRLTGKLLLLPETLYAGTSLCSEESSYDPLSCNTSRL